MSQNDMSTVRYILARQQHHDLALKLENAEFTHYTVSDDWQGNFGGIRIFIHPQHYLQLQSLSKEDETLLINIFNGMLFPYDTIVSISFFINSDIKLENVSDTVYIFVDEAGDMDFSSKGSKYYMFNFLVKNRPFNLHEYIANYRYSLLERNLNPLNGPRLDIEAFHAHNDNKYIKEELFTIISTFDTNSVKAYAYILEKPKVDPGKREEKDRFYIENLSFSIQRLLDKLGISKNFIIITDRLPVQQNKSKQIGALKKGIKEYMKKNKLNQRYDIFHHCSASSANLQIVDYISWAIFRKYEHSQNNYYDKIKSYILDEEIMTKDRIINHY